LDDATRNEVINLLRRSEFSDLNSNLIKLLSDEKESDRFKSFIIQHLGVSLLNDENKTSREEIAIVLHTQLESKILVVKKESFLALLNVKDEVALKKMDAIFKSNKEEDCLEIAIRFAFKLDLDKYKPNLRTYLKSTNKDVKLVAIHYLGEWKDEQSKDFFKECLKSEDLQIYQAGKLSLKLLESKK
jgi:HEAT repeat protein